MIDRVRVKTGDEIHNARTGQRMAFRKTADDTAGRELIIECWSPPDEPGGPREPLHTHPNQEKRFRVIEGELHVACDGVERLLRAGDEITVASHQVHSFWNGSDREVHYWQEFRPALSSAEFFTTLFALARDGKLNSSGKPSLLQFAVMGDRFRRELMVASPPPWLQRVLFAVVGPIARLLGYESERV